MNFSRRPDVNYYHCFNDKQNNRGSPEESFMTLGDALKR
jgi:hypothetical protein